MRAMYHPAMEHHANAPPWCCCWAAGWESASRSAIDDRSFLRSMISHHARRDFDVRPGDAARPRKSARCAKDQTGQQQEIDEMTPSSDACLNFGSEQTALTVRNGKAIRPFSWIRRGPAAEDCRKPGIRRTARDRTPAELCNIRLHKQKLPISTGWNVRLFSLYGCCV